MEDIMSKNFKDLKVWQDAKQLAVEIYKAMDNETFNKNYGLRDQIQRSAVSIASNIAEGCERDSDKDFIRFLNIAKGSLAELITQLEIAHEVGYLTKSQLLYYEEKYNEVSAMIGALIKYLRKNQS